MIPVAAPFPYIACHVVEAIAIRRERCNWSSLYETILLCILVREDSFPTVGLCFVCVHVFISPGVDVTCETSSCSPFPFGFGGQSLACPFAVGHRIEPAHVHDGMIHPVFNAASRSFWMAPVGTCNPAPPFVVIVQIYRTARLLEYQRCCNQYAVGWTWRARRKALFQFLPVGFTFRSSDITCRLHKFCKLCIRHFGLIEIECIQPYLVFREFVGTGLLIVATHLQNSTGNQNHSRGVGIICRRNGIANSSESRWHIHAGMRISTSICFRYPALARRNE